VLGEPWTVTGVRAFLGVDDVPAARRWLRVMNAQAARRPSAMTEACLRYGEGLIALATGRPAQARELLGEAISGLDTGPRRWEALWARLDHAVALARTRRPLAARARLAEVSEAATVMRSQPLLKRADEIGATLGRRGAPSPWSPLTAREYEVACRVASGLTNAEIGGELGVATRTVGAHVEHILTKLNVGRRAEIGAWVASQRRDGTG
jgi:DNA-binding CsgD family transcriptional regulator